MRFVLLVAIVLAGVAGGGLLAVVVRPAPAPPAGTVAPDPHGSGTAPAAVDPAAAATYVKISRQIIVPVVDGGTTRALMLFEIALDVPPAHRDEVIEREPRLRDAFLRELFEMSHAGAFRDAYTSERVMTELREKLLAAARVHLREKINDVLILDALRQEL